MIEFFKNLRVPIPPIIGLGEIISTKFFGSPMLITVFAYRISLVGVYCLAIILAGTTCKRMISSFFISMLFLYVTTIIHPGNPQNYDIFFPFFFLMYIWLVKKTSTLAVDRKWLNILLPCGAGFFLAMTDLTRSFVIFILPLLIFSAYWSFNAEIRKKQFIAFILPVLLLSGGWHGYQFVVHQQVTFSNHAGFNLYRAWPHVPYDVILESEKNNTPIKPGRRVNLNTAEHSSNSKEIQQSLLQYWLNHPYASFIHALTRVKHLLGGETAIYSREPQSGWFGVYKLIVYITAGLLLFNAGMLCFQGVRFFKRIPQLLANPDNTILLFAAASIVLLAIGDSGEEARFLISVLPLLAVLSIFRFCSGSADQPKPVRW